MFVVLPLWLRYVTMLYICITPAHWLLRPNLKEHLGKWFCYEETLLFASRPKTIICTSNTYTIVTTDMIHTVRGIAFLTHALSSLPITSDQSTSWPIRVDCAFQKVTKTKQRVKRGAAAIWKSNVFLNFKSCKCILADFVNKICELVNEQNMGTLRLYFEDFHIKGTSQTSSSIKLEPH